MRRAPISVAIAAAMISDAPVTGSGPRDCASASAASRLTAKPAATITRVRAMPGRAVSVMAPRLPLERTPAADRHPSSRSRRLHSTLDGA